VTDTSSIALPKIVRVIPRNRNIEFLLLLFAAGLYAFELAQVQLSVLEVMTPELLLYWAPVTLIGFVIHFILRRRASEADPMILPIAVVLNNLGLAMIYRLDLAAIANDNPELFGMKQIAWTLLAMAVAAIVIIYVPSHLFLRRYVYVSMVIGIALLLAPSLPIIGRSINGARLWIGIGPFTFQPGELAKIALTVFFAGYLVTRRESLALTGRKILGMRIPRARELGPILVIWAASLLVLVLQRDLGTSLLYFGLFIVLVYVATGRAIYVIVGLTMFLTGALVASRLMGYVSSRIDSWLNPFDSANYDAVGGSYQLAQGIFGPRKPAWHRTRRRNPAPCATGRI
jgi:cell division protein FtsW (lipid II flippase)